MTARPHRKDDEAPEAAAEPLDPEYVRMIQESLDDPRPSIPAEEVRRHLQELHEERLRRDAKEEQPQPAGEPLDPEFVRMIQEALDDPRPSIPADEAFAQVYAHIERRRSRPPVDENDPERQAYLRQKIRESLDDPSPDLSAEEVAESLRAHHEERLRRGP